MVNRGFDILPQIAGDIDMVMAESTYADWIPSEKKAKFVPKAEYKQIVDTLNAGKVINPRLRVYSLDYWNMKDAKTVKSIYAAQRASGFIPYVSTPDLQTIYIEP
jgi:hypothetical protein